MQGVILKFNALLDSIKTYEAGKPIELVVREFGIEPKDIVKLASNENPLGCSTKVQAQVSKSVSQMFRYPDDSMLALKKALAEHFGVSEHNTIIGAGSDQIIEFLVHAKANASSKILMNSITFAMYEIYARHVGAQIVRTTSRAHDLEEFYALYLQERPAIIFLCTPNNPTGDAISTAALFAFLEKIDSETMVVVDGAYMEYAAYKDSNYAIDVNALVTRFSNVIYLGTFSKVYGLGGMRVGYGIASEQIITALYKLRPPFNITTLSMAAALVALQDQAFVKQSVTHNANEMQRYYTFANTHNIEVIESYTNFITLLLAPPLQSKEIAQRLLEQGMIVRDLTGYGLNAIRVTIGTEAENSRFFELFTKVLPA